MIKTALYFVALVVLIGCDKMQQISSEENSNQPNILLLIADDMGLDAAPGYEEGQVKPNMPHLTKLISTGLTFENAWAYPQCAPTRASIITGKYGVHNGVLNTSDAGKLPADEKTIQAYLDEKLGKVYSHSIIGKWHLSNREPNRPEEMGIDYYAGVLGGVVSSYDNWTFTTNGESSEKSTYVTAELTDLAIDWIGGQSKPWFCWMAYTSPHTPFHVPPPGTHSQGELSADASAINENPLPYYMAMMENLDYEIGRLLANIPEEELSNTIIIFIGDNGTAGNVIQSPYQRNRSKGSLHQGGIHVPLVVAGKGVSRLGERETQLVNSTDLFATIAEIAGVDADKYEDSYSFKKLLSNTEVEGTRDYNYSEILNTDSAIKSGYTIRDERYKLIVLDNNTMRFYDLQNDPYENANLMREDLTSEEEQILEDLQEKAKELRK